MGENCHDDRGGDREMKGSGVGGGQAWKGEQVREMWFGKKDGHK